MIKEKKGIFIRMTENDKEILKQTSEEYGLSITAYVTFLINKDLKEKGKK